MAWVPTDPANPSGERWLKCLLCAKWLADVARRLQGTPGKSDPVIPGTRPPSHKLFGIKIVCSGVDEFAVVFSMFVVHMVHCWDDVLFSLSACVDVACCGCHDDPGIRCILSVFSFLI